MAGTLHLVLSSAGTWPGPSPGRLQENSLLRTDGHLGDGPSVPTVPPPLCCRDEAVSPVPIRSPIPKTLAWYSFQKLTDLVNLFVLLPTIKALKESMSVQVALDRSPGGGGSF